VTVAILTTTRAYRLRSARIGFPACMNGNSSSSPTKESTTGRPDNVLGLLAAHLLFAGGMKPITPTVSTLAIGGGAPALVGVVIGVPAASIVYGRRETVDALRPTAPRPQPAAAWTGDGNSCHPEERGISAERCVRTRGKRDSSPARNDTICARRYRQATAEEPSMQITRSSRRHAKGPAFTGDVYINTVAAPAGLSRARAALVHCTPGARTAWHTHPLGQTIYVTEGIGRCQRRGGPVEEIRPGDRVFFEPGEEHWHGAAPNRSMTHLVMQEADESGSVVTWGERVTDEEYGQEPA
jgi:quercetin dioxygenase-like cupin family protein